MTYEQERALDALTQRPEFTGMYSAKPVEKDRLKVTASWQYGTFNTFTAILLPTGQFIQRKMSATDHKVTFKEVPSAV